MSQFTRASCSSCPSHTSHNQGCISQPPWSSLFLPLMQPVPPSVSLLSSLSSQAAVWPAGCSTGSTCSCGSPVCLTCLWAKTITHIERERERGKGARCQTTFTHLFSLEMSFLQRAHAQIFGFLLRASFKAV